MADLLKVLKEDSKGKGMPEDASTGIECQANQATATSAECTVAWGICNIFSSVMGNMITSFCRRLCPRSVETTHVEPETERLIPRSNSPLNDFPFPPYGSLAQQSIDVATPDRSTDVQNRIRNIIDGVENQVIDAGATRYPALDTQQSMERGKYYSERVAHTALGPPVIPIILPRAVGNPVAIITAPMPDYEQRYQDTLVEFDNQLGTPSVRLCGGNNIAHLTSFPVDDSIGEVSAQSPW